MDNNSGTNLPQAPEPAQGYLAVPQPSKKWYKHKGVIAIAGLAVLTTFVSWVALSKQPKAETNLVVQEVKKTATWKTYADKEFGFSLDYPADLYFVPGSNYSQASSTGGFSLQSVPAPQLFQYYLGANNKLNPDFRPYHRSGFTIEVQPGEYASGDGSVDFVNQQVAQKNDCKGSLATIDVSGVNSYEYALTGEAAGDLIIIVPYSVGQYVELDFKTSYGPNSAEYINAKQTFDKLLTTFKFTNTQSLAALLQERAQAMSQITWQKYSNQFLEFEYSSDFKMGTGKTITDHKPQPNGKDMYGFTVLTLGDDIVDSGSLDITVLPNIAHLGDEQFVAIQKDFEADRSEPADSFIFTTVDGVKASFAHKELFDHFDPVVCKDVSRLGSNKINFFTKDYSYEITLTWLMPENNSPDSVLQKEFQRFLSSLHILTNK